MLNKKVFWHRLIFIFLALVLAGSVLVAACGDDDETPTPTVTKTATPTQTATATPTETVTAPPSATPYPIPVKPDGWQELPDEQKDAFNISYYFPGEWITMTSQPLPTIILALDPTFFPNSELRMFDVAEGTTNADFREWIKANYPSEAGGEYDNFEVLEEGDITLDNGFETVYMIYKGTRMGYGAQALAVFLVRGTQGFILTGGDYPVTFEDSQEQAMQIVKTLHSTIAFPDSGTVEPTSTPTGTVTAPPMPSGWQELPQDLQDTFQVNYYFPGEWITMTTQPLPTVILALDPTFFPNSELRMFEIEDGTTPGQFRDWVINNYPSEAGGEYDGFTVLDQGNITLDDGTKTVYLQYKGTRMGYGAQALGVIMTKGTQGFILTGGDYPVTFEDSKDLLTQIVKTLHSLTPLPEYPVEPTVEPTEEPTAEPTEEPTAEPTEEPTVEPTAEPTGEEEIHTGLDIDSTIGELMENEYTKAVLGNYIAESMANPQWTMAYGMTLKQIQPYHADVYTDEVLAAIAADLLAIK